MRNKMKAGSNRGGALLSVIIAMSVVGILAAVVLSISYTNFRMKQVDKKSKDNFYSAEAVLDEICVGLQGEISKQYTKAYTTVMEQYGSYITDEKDHGIDAIKAMQEDFNLEFVLNMVEALEDPAKGGYYDLNNKFKKYYDFEEKIKKYVNAANYPAGDSFTIDTIYTVKNDGSEQAQNILETVENGVVLRNIKVSYTHQGYTNTITTDIRIETPKVTFTKITTMPEIESYCLIAQDGMNLNSMTLKVKGNAFWGADVQIENGAVLKADKDDTEAKEIAKTMIVEGDVKILNSSKLYAGGTTSLWVNSIDALGGGNIISVKGRTYVKDDTSVAGRQNQLILAGQYFGYSDSAIYPEKPETENEIETPLKHAQSSAIIINGGNTDINLDGLKTLMVAGTAFVTKKEQTYTSEVLMGESIAVKGNQIAYLVPVECNGIIANPMTVEQFETMATADPKWAETALATYLPALKRRLDSYGEVTIQKLFDARSGVYLFLNFAEEEAAAEYFMEYYGSEAGKKIKDYLLPYISAFQFETDEHSRIVTQGNYLVEHADADVRAIYQAGIGDVRETTQERSNLLETYNTLCKKLVENKTTLTADELEETSTVYSNMIDNDKVISFVAAAKAGKITGAAVSADNENAVIIQDAAGNTCIVVDGEYKVTNAGKGIIIATGDVEVNSWSGLIITNGKVIKTGGNAVTVQADSKAFSRAMRLTYDSSEDAMTHSVSEFFKDGDAFSSGKTSAEKDAKADVRDCIAYENWKSE